MKKTKTIYVAMVATCVTAMVAYSCGDSNNKPKDGGEAKTDLMNAGPSGAFKNHRDSVPTKAQYDGPLFELSHDYPTTISPVVDPSWQKALGGKPIGDANAIAYMDSLKSYIAPRMLPFFTNNKEWTAAKYGWYQEPWVSVQREAILGAYLGNGNPANMFKSLPVAEAGYALVLYDATAGYTLGEMWGKTGQKLNLLKDAAQFKEGSIIVKLAFSNINYPTWSVMQGAQTFSIYDTIPTGQDTLPGYRVRTVSFFQMDVIVKDSKTSPKTGWVFSTFVYDMNAKGSTWEKMVPLGAMWGNDPGVNSPLKPPYPKLYETVINPAAPPYSKETLGWGGRLSGPNDGAVVQLAYDVNTHQPYVNLALSSCMSCHSPAQDTAVANLFPAPNSASDSLYVYTPGSAQWNMWFRDNPGNVAFTEGQTSLDYDMVMTLGSIPGWLASLGQPSGQLTATRAPEHATDNRRFINVIEASKKFRHHHTPGDFRK